MDISLRLPMALFIATLCSLVACSDKPAPEVPQAQSLTREAIGYFCGMIVADHPGPKGQVILRERAEALWFSSVRDTLAYTRLPEETDPVAAIYVTDVSRAVSWDAPGEDAWIEIHNAVYVVGSNRRGGMGAPEIVPFSSRIDAEAFTASFGGRILTLEGVPDDALLGAWGSDEGAGH